MEMEKTTEEHVWAEGGVGKNKSSIYLCQVCNAYYPPKENGIWIFEVWSPGEIDVWVGDI